MAQEVFQGIEEYKETQYVLILTMVLNLFFVNQGRDGVPGSSGASGQDGVPGRNGEVGPPGPDGPPVSLLFALVTLIAV